MTEPIVVVGGTPAALVAADALAARGRDVRLLLPERGVGGGFVARRVDGRVLELGHEMAAGAPPALADYRPSTTGHRPWLTLIEGLVRDLVGDRLQRIEPPRMVVHGRLADDIFLTVDPAGIAVVGDADRAIAHDELAGADGPGVLAAPLGDMTLAEASLANHGPTVHRRLIEPLCGKLVDGGAQRVLAELRRRVWMPLFWPQTVREACNGGTPAFRPDRPLFTIRDGGLGELIDALLARLHGSEHVDVQTVGTLTRVAPAADGVALSFAAGADVVCRRPVLAVPARELFAAADVALEQERTRTVVAWVEVAEGDVMELPAIVHIVDAALPALRVTVGHGAPAGRRLLCVELRHDLAEDAIDGAVRTSLEGAGLVVKDAAIRPITWGVASTFPVPTADNRRAFVTARTAFDALGVDAELVGGAVDPAGDFLNEQIVGGLRAAEVLA